MIPKLNPTYKGLSTAIWKEMAEYEESVNAQQDKRDFLFRFVPQAVRYGILVDEEAMYSTTDQVTSRKICDEIVKLTGHNTTVVDATSCVGGLTYTLACVFDKIIAIELDATRFRYLEENMRLLQVAHKVTCLQGDALSVCDKLNAGIIVLDPPWGGPEYKLTPSVHLTLGGLDIGDVCILLFKNNPATGVIALKVPMNFDEAAFRTCVETAGHTIAQKAKLRKMYLFLIRR
jgi:hypothetical protein